MHDGWMFGMGWWWIVVLILVVGAVWAVLRSQSLRSGGPKSGQAEKNPEEVLSDRLARGEIDEAEYESRLAALRRRR